MHCATQPQNNMSTRFSTWTFFSISGNIDTYQTQNERYQQHEKMFVTRLHKTCYAIEILLFIFHINVGPGTTAEVTN